MSLEVSVHSFLKDIILFNHVHVCLRRIYTGETIGVRSPGVTLPGSGEQPDMMLGTELTAGWGASSARTVP